MSNIPDNNRLDRDSLRIEIMVDADVALPVDENSLQIAAQAAAAFRGYDGGEIVVRVTADETIHELNRDHLGHDYPTDVISFAYHRDRPTVEGELAVSAETASRRAAELGWPSAHELVLYVVHGVLHITGMDDHHDDDRAAMRQAEQSIMLQLGIDDIVSFGADAAQRPLLEEPT